MKAKVLIFGATGFIGSSLSSFLSEEYDIIKLKIDEDEAILESNIKEAAIIIHASGVSRSDKENDFFHYNIQASTILFELISKYQDKTIIYFSSIHYQQDNLYGVSKRYNEYLINQAKLNTKNRVFCYRTPGVFGKGSKHDYVSVVSTFCYRIANNLPVNVTDPSKTLELIWIEDLMTNIKDNINEKFQPGTNLINPKVNLITVGALYDTVIKFNSSNIIEDNLFKDDIFENKLYNTFLHFKKNML